MLILNILIPPYRLIIEKIQLDGYNLIRADHPINTTRGGACIYYKNLLGIKVLDAPSINGCLFCEISVQNRICFCFV